MMATSKPSVTKAAPLAAQANKRSATVPDSQGLRCVAGAELASEAAALRKAVVLEVEEDITAIFNEEGQRRWPDMRGHIRLRLGLTETIRRHYFQAIALPEVSLISPQALNTSCLTLSGIGT